MPNVNEIIEQRGNMYGAFKGHAMITQRLKQVIADELQDRLKYLPAEQQEALDMICHKIGRIINGDNNYDDNWIDICGYSQLVVNSLQGKDNE